MIREIHPDSLIVGSDTKTWGGSGIPDVEHVRDILSYWAPANFRQHQVVMFDRTLAPPPPPPAPLPRDRPTGRPHVSLKKQRPKKPRKGRFKAWQCQKAFMTTLNDVRYGGDSESPDGAGHSWYWFVGPKGDIAVIPTEELPA